MKNPILIISTLIAASSMAWLEIDIDPSISWGHRMAIMSIGLGRLVLFYESGHLWGVDKSRAKWVTFFSFALALVIGFYAQNIEGVSNNGRILYHTSNVLLLFLEWTLAFTVIASGKDREKIWNDTFDKIELEADKYKAERDELVRENGKNENIRIKLKAAENKLNALEAELRANENTVNALRKQVSKYENIAHMVDHVFIDGNVYRYMSSEDVCLYSLGRNQNEIKLKSGKVVFNKNENK